MGVVKWGHCPGHGRLDPRPQSAPAGLCLLLQTVDGAQGQPESQMIAARFWGLVQAPATLPGPLQLSGGTQPNVG